MAKIPENIPKLPERLPLIIHPKRIVLPGYTQKTTIEEKRMKNPKLSKSEVRLKSFNNFICLAHSAKIGTIGTATRLHLVHELNGGYMVVNGICRIRIQKVLAESKDACFAEIVQLNYPEDLTVLGSDPIIQLLVKYIRNLLSAAVQVHKIPFHYQRLKQIPVSHLAEISCYYFNFTFEQQLKILNAVDLAERLKAAIIIIKIKNILRQEKVLISSDPITVQKTEYKKLETRIRALDLPPNVKFIVQGELKELSHTEPMSSQYNILNTYLNLVAALPWNKYVKETLNLQKTRSDLEVDHFGSQKVKQRILEYLAVRKLRNDVNSAQKGPVLCLVGPPGVGKTSMARSIAATLNRPFERVSLGGVNNMSDIRGNRRVYVGAMPGRIIQALKSCGVKNPVILLDEIDKMSNTVNGDPGAALLEVLDPAQNKEFLDHYLNIPFDLSQILFIATANTAQNLSSALFDRMEMISITGYTYLEKLQIAKKFLLPKQLDESGLNSEYIYIVDETFQLIIDSYTCEAGVRDLERKIGSLCRSVALKIALNNSINIPIIIDIVAAEEILGPLRNEYSKWAGRLGKPGIAVGLVESCSRGNTAVVESTLMPGRGKFFLTGLLGDVMKESAHLAWGWFRSNAHMYGIVLNAKRLSSIDIHIHFPEGSVHKDGSSAGVTIATALISLFLDRPLLPNIAMTGEISLRGVVLPVGGIKSKVIAAHKDGFTKVIIPQDNEKDLDDIPSSIKDDLTFVLAANMHTIIETVFESEATACANNI